MDNLFIKGNHAICQDYSLTLSHGDKSVLIVSDGCSNSKDTDIGSRLLCYSAKSAMLGNRYYSSHINNWNTLLYQESLGFQIITDAKMIAACAFNLPCNCLDATLLIGIWDHKQKKGKAFCYGDGTVIWKTNKNDKLNFVNLSYESNAPYYLSYSLNAENKKRYFENYGDKNLISVEVLSEEVNKNFYPYDKYIEFSFDESTTMLALASDGLSSFEKDKAAVNISTIIDPFFAFKNTNGEYLKRRVDKYLKQLNKEGYSHYDDISLATLLIKD